MTAEDRYPWNASRKRIQEFETTRCDGTFSAQLPQRLSADQFRRLFNRHRPREFFAESMFSEILEHKAGSQDLCEEIALITIHRQSGVYHLGAALAVHLSSACDDLAWLCELGLQELELEYGLGPLLHSAKSSGDADDVRSVEYVLALREENKRICRDIRKALARKVGAEARVKVGRGRKHSSEERRLTPWDKACIPFDCDRMITFPIARLHESHEWPWNASRRALEKFETDPTIRNYGTYLPRWLENHDLWNLFHRHEPREYVSYRMLALLVSHPACPSDVFDQVWRCIRPMLLSTRSMALSVASGAPLAPSTRARILRAPDARRMLVSAVENLCNRWRETGDREARRELTGVLKLLPQKTLWDWFDGLQES